MKPVPPGEVLLADAYIGDPPCTPLNLPSVLLPSASSRGASIKGVTPLSLQNPLDASLPWEHIQTLTV